MKDCVTQFTTVYPSTWSYMVGRRIWGDERHLPYCLG